ncbi:MAG TPA: PfkB family carbohydrate kinase [Candidatus Acidoferrales bacterium]|nr:PfkB family carbohydrate kinase [Candidatus Acidoferrales bacterium]
MSADLTRLEEFVEGFTKQTIAVLADFVADKFVFGEISRVSREAPVLILRHRETQLVPGGGANAANNLTDLGARVLPVGVVGDDAPGRELLDYFRRKNVDASGIVSVRGWTTPVKTRYLAGWTHTTRQQVLRVDHEPTAPLGPAAQKAILSKAKQHMRRANALLASDYGFGAVTPALLGSLRRFGGPKIKITLDSRYSLGDYKGAGVTAATPNEAELEALYHTRIGSDSSRLQKLAAQTMRSLELEALVVTRGKDGMVAFERGEKPRTIPIYGSEEAADVTGAGDTVIAVFTLALAAGASVLEAAELANYAAGIVVMKRGTATVRRDELLAAIRGEATGRDRPRPV